MILSIALKQWLLIKAKLDAQAMKYELPNGQSILVEHLTPVLCNVTNKTSYYINITFADEKEASWFILSYGGIIIS